MQRTTRDRMLRRGRSELNMITRDRHSTDTSTDRVEHLDTLLDHSTVGIPSPAVPQAMADLKNEPRR